MKSAKYGKFYKTSVNGNGFTGGRVAYAQRMAKGARFGGGLAIVLGSVDIYQGVKADGNSFGYNARRATAGVAGGIIGGSLGGKLGALGGGAVSGGNPVGVIVGAVGGSMAGGTGGSMLGHKIVDKAYGVEE